MADIMLTPAEVAEKLRLNISTVQRLLRNKSITHINLGYRTKRIRQSALNAYLKAREKNINRS